MRHSFLFLTILLIGLNLSQALECTVPNQMQTRIFDSVIHYQANKVPFNILSPDWGGSDVAFNCTSIAKLPKNVFVTYDSQHIIRMKLNGKHIEKIDEGAFISLKCLHELLLNRNDISQLPKNAFQDLLNLEKLDLSYNKLEYLPDLVFTNLIRLKMLDLSGNQIKNVQSLAFGNLQSLEVLNLEMNKLQTVPLDVFSPLTSLRILTLASNLLSDIQPEKWANLSNLQNLNLAGNYLNHFDPSYDFSFGKSLKSLNLSSNSLTKLNVVALNRHLPNLTFVDLNGNPWLCSDLQIIVNELSTSSIKFASGNFSKNSVHGIACNDVPVYSTTAKILTSTTEGSTTTKYQPPYNKSYINSVVEKNIKEENEKIMNSIGYLQNSVIVLFVLVFIFASFEILLRTDCCRGIYSRLKGRNEMYFDNGNVENFRLLGR